MKQGKVWSFKTERFEVALMIERDRHYKYDGDDEDGEIQSKLDSGEYVAFNSAVVVKVDENEIASDHLGGSVYAADNYKEFWTSHRDPDFLNRNCSLMRAVKGENVMIGHYFPDMVRTACEQAREWINRYPEMRKSA